MEVNGFDQRDRTKGKDRTARVAVPQGRYFGRAAVQLRTTVMGDGALC